MIRTLESFKKSPRRRAAKALEERRYGNEVMRGRNLARANQDRQRSGSNHSSAQAFTQSVQNRTLNRGTRVHSVSGRLCTESLPNCNLAADTPGLATRRRYRIVTKP